MAERSLNPCPYLNLKEEGPEAVIGVIGGSLAYAAQGALSAPRGSRMKSAIQALDFESRVQDPTTRNFWAWIGLVSAFGCVITSYRQKYDIWTGVFAGAGASGVLSANRGPCGALSGVTVGATIMGAYGYTSSRYGGYITGNTWSDQTPEPPQTTTC